jgi:hypothetical protein
MRPAANAPIIAPISVAVLSQEEWPRSKAPAVTPVS